MQLFEKHSIGALGVLALSTVALTPAQATLGTIVGAYQPASGSIRYKGAEISGRSAKANVIDGIALVPEGRRLFSFMTVRENLELGSYAPPLRASMTTRLELLEGRTRAKKATLSVAFSAHDAAKLRITDPLRRALNTWA